MEISVLFRDFFFFFAGYFSDDLRSGVVSCLMVKCKKDVRCMMTKCETEKVRWNIKTEGVLYKTAMTCDVKIRERLATLRLIRKNQATAPRSSATKKRCPIYESSLLQ